MEPMVHPQTQTCLLAENQQEEDSYYPGILSEHELRKYLICNDISNVWDVGILIGCRA
jgi:hypothetical protein